jgi:hypothetical protein
MQQDQEGNKLQNSGADWKDIACEKKELCAYGGCQRIISEMYREGHRHRELVTDTER